MPHATDGCLRFSQGIWGGDFEFEYYKSFNAVIVLKNAWHRGFLFIQWLDFCAVNSHFVGPVRFEWFFRVPKPLSDVDSLTEDMLQSSATTSEVQPVRNSATGGVTCYVEVYDDHSTEAGDSKNSMSLKRLVFVSRGLLAKCTFSADKTFIHHLSDDHFHTLQLLRSLYAFFPFFPWHWILLIVHRR